MRKTNLKSVLSHIALFVVVEVIFVLIVFRELPAINLYTSIWIAHLIYWIVVLLCSVWREKATQVMIKFIALWTPMVLHLGIHIFIWLETLEEHWHDHHEWEETLWLIIWTLVAWIIIYFGEKLLHRNQHCATHHTHAHKECIENNHQDCENCK